MKYLTFLLVVLIFVSCSDMAKNEFSVSAQTENLIKVDNINSAWNDGLVNHLQIIGQNLHSTNLIYFDSLQKFNYSDNISIYAKKHFRLNNNSSEPMATIQANIENIDGVFVGIVRPISTTSVLPDEELIIALTIIEKNLISGNCQPEKVKFYGNSKIKYFFKCTNRDLGTWVRMSLSDPLIAKFNSNKRGYFIGKNNLKNHIFDVNNNTAYFYIGYRGAYGNLNEIPELMALSTPYFSNFPTNNIFSSTKSNSSDFPRYLSTIGGIKVQECWFYISNHWTIRPCPNNCPE